MPYAVWNETDAIYAHPEHFKTEAAAKRFVARFRERFRIQGYYFTFDMRRIALDEVDIRIRRVPEGWDGGE